MESYGKNYRQRREDNSAGNYKFVRERGGNTMSLGERLKSLRLKEKRTLESQSDLCGVKLNTVFRWEHDRAIPKEAELKKIAELHGVPISWLTQDCDIKYRTEHDVINKQLFSMFDKLSYGQKHKILGYIERVYIEGSNDAK
jgi:transcriptional regulator with XRE-family HTH domain